MTTEPDQSTPASTESFAYGEDDSQEYVDRSLIDFDPADGLYSGTAVDGTSEIPGPHEVDGPGGGPEDRSGDRSGQPVGEA